MKRLFLVLLLITACADRPPKKEESNGIKVKQANLNLPPSYEKAQDLLLKMTQKEKVQMLKSYMTLRALSSSHVNPTVSSPRIITGIPRLGIPSIQLVEEDTVSTKASAPLRTKGKVLKLGTVNLIRNFEKEQVYGNFEQAENVESVLSPSGKKNMEMQTENYDLQDLDIFMVKSGSEETTVKDYICAIHRKKDQEYTCVESKFEETVAELKLNEGLPEALEKGNLTPSQIDTLVLRMLASMYELKIIR